MCKTHKIKLLYGTFVNYSNVSYLDDTAFDNGKKFEWSVRSMNEEGKVLSEIIETFANLP